MNKILVVAMVILVLAGIGILSYKLGLNQRTPPVPPKQEIQTVQTEPPNPVESLSAPPGIDPISGRPVISATSSQKETSPIPNPQNFGTPPPQESYPKMSSDYPYFAKLPTGVEKKVQVAYNYVVEFPQRYLVEIKVTNNSNQTLEKVYYDEFLKDGGNILNEIKDEGHHNSPPYFPLQPGESTTLKTCRTSVPPGFGDLTSFGTWKVEIEVTYLKLN